MPIEAYTGISIQMYHSCLQKGHFLPYNWERPLSLDYQQQISGRFNYFWYAYPVLDLLVNSYPDVAREITSRYFRTEHAYESNTTEVAIADARHHAVWASIANCFYEATDVWVDHDQIASLAWSNESLASKRALNRFIQTSIQIGLGLDLNTNIRVGKLKRSLVEHLGSGEKLFDVLVNHVFDSPKGTIAGWTRAALDSADSVAIGVESDREIIISSDTPLPINLFEFQFI